MTRINKIVMNGFKSFGKRTELFFDSDFNIVLGPNGSGKCTVGATKVQMADGSIQRIDGLVNDKIKTNATKKLDDGVVASGDNTEILCLDTKTLKIRKKKVQAFIKRTSPKQLVKITTRAGKEIIATEYHPFFTIKDKAIQSVNAEDLSIGTRIAMPRCINLRKNDLLFAELLDLISEKDAVYVPYKEEYRKIIVSVKKNKLWKEVANLANVPLNAIKGLLDKQSINFAYLVRILRYCGLKEEEIINFITHIKSKTSNNIYPLP